VIADLCTEVAPAPADPADAAAYAQTGDDARAAGDLRIAAVAYRKAIALGDARAKQALAELCRSDAEPGDATALQTAIELIGHGRLVDARVLLRRIVANGTSSAAGAHFFLGVIALRHHDGGEAEAHFAIAARDPEYADSAEPMLRLARRAGRVEANLFTGAEVDTNPQLLPDTPPPGATTAPRSTDEDAVVTVAATARPWRWLVLHDAVVWRQQRTQTELDFFGENAQAGVELDHGPEHVAIRYDLDYDVLAGAPYLTANRATAAYRHELGGTDLVASYSLRRRDFWRDQEQPFTGWVHMGDAGTILHATPSLDIDARLVGWRELTADRLFSNLAGGAQAVVHARPSTRVRLDATIAGWYAAYDAAEADGERRRDVHIEGGADVEVDLSDHVVGVASVTAAGNESTIDDFDYWKLVVRLGVALLLGGP
jgi:hypothetical protein